jgi:hypothetical protein
VDIVFSGLVRLFLVLGHNLAPPRPTAGAVYMSLSIADLSVAGRDLQSVSVRLMIVNFLAVSPQRTTAYFAPCTVFFSPLLEVPGVLMPATDYDLTRIVFLDPTSSRFGCDFY